MVNALQNMTRAAGVTCLVYNHNRDDNYTKKQIALKNACFYDKKDSFDTVDKRNFFIEQLM